MPYETNEDLTVPIDILQKPKDYDKALPFLSRTLSFVHQLRRATKPRNRQNILDHMTSFIVSDPSSVQPVLDNFDLIRGVDAQPDLLDFEDALIEHLVKVVGKRGNLASWTPQNIEGLVLLSQANHDKPGEVASKVERALFTAPGSTPEAVDLFYNAAWAMVSTKRREVMEEIFSVLCYEKGWLQADSFPAFYFTLAHMLAENIHIKRYYAILEALSNTGQCLESDESFLVTHSARFRTRTNRIAEVELSLISKQRKHLPLSPDEDKRSAIFVHMGNKYRSSRLKFEEYYARGSESNQDIPFVYTGGDFQALFSQYQRQQDKIKNLPWPISLTMDPYEPLRAYLRQDFMPRLLKTSWEGYCITMQESGFKKLTDRPIELPKGLELDLIARDVTTEEERNSTVREVRESILKEEAINPRRELPQSIKGLKQLLEGDFMALGHFDSEGRIIYCINKSTNDNQVGRLSSILRYHRPAIEVAKHREIEQQLKSLRGTIGTMFSRGIGRRGYEHPIADPVLVAMGYQTFVFTQPDENQALNVNLTIDNHEYSYSLDQNYQVVEKGDIKRFDNYQSQLWLELLTLAHIEKIMCTDESQLVFNLVGGEKQLKFYRQQVVRRVEHLRRLPIGQSYSKEQYLACLRSSLPIKRLDLINRLRAQRGEGGTGETGVYTYVSPVEKVDASTAKPIRIAFSNAIEAIRAVIQLAEVSPEEKDRLEGEILSGF